MPTKPADRTSSIAQPSDFESQLQALAFEATPLHLVPAVHANLTGDDTAWLHGPWDPQQCATILLRWLEADLVVLLESTATTEGDQVVTESRQLTYDQSHTLLTEPHSFAPPALPAGPVHLVYSGERALEVDDDVWWSAARSGGVVAQDGGNPTSPRRSSHAGATQELAALAPGAGRILSRTASCATSQG